MMASYCQQVLRARAAPFAAAVVAAAAASTVCEDHEHSSRSWLTLLVPAVMGDAASLPPAEKQAQDMARLKAWLTEHGADVSHIDFRTSKIGHDSGIGIYLADGQKPMQSKRRRWWTPFSPAPPYAIAAEFPLSLAITADNILNDSDVGRQYSWMLQRGVVDERLVLQCYLAVERSRGQASRLHPWIAVLPNEFHSPLCWTDVELVELRGTPLLRATLTLRTRLTDQWQRLRVPLAEVAQHLGSPHPPAYEDLVWAHCVFWSRGQSLPVPRTPGAASRLAAQTSARQSLTVHEGIVPGLDFANHNGHGAGCWWEVVQPGMDTAAAGSDKPAGSVRPLSTARVRLQLHRGWQARAGDELTINYGDGKSNEELLLLYGFVSGEGAAQADTVMVACPVPPQSEWDGLTAARMELLTSYGMRPQFFLRGTGPLDNSKPTTSTTSEGHSASVPLEVLESLEVFVLKPEEVVERLEALHAHQARRQQGMSDAVLPTHLSGAELDLDQVVKLLKQKPTPAQLKQLAVQLGLRMAAVTTYIRLLEVRLIEMEGKEQGTGSLEEDEELLRRHAAASTASGDAGEGGVEAQAGTVLTAPAGGRVGSGGGRGQGGPEGRRGGRGGSGGRGGQGPPGYVEGAQSGAGPKSAAGVLPYRRWCAVVYRAGQKRVVRAHLVGARQELQRVIDLLAQVDDLQVLKK